MVTSPSLESTNPVTGIRLSSVVPAKATGDKDHELSNMDLAVKLHYIKGVYFFKSEAVQGLNISDFKTPFFRLLEPYYTVSGRIRRSESTSRPFIKCNDGGVRIVEAFSDKTIDEWLETNINRDDSSLVYNQVLGPDLGFSPLVFVQFTSFKCGGISIGLRWAHILGDPITASTFINKWAQTLSGQVTSESLPLPIPKKSSNPENVTFMKKVNPVVDHWQITNQIQLETHSFNITSKQLQNMVSSICDSEETKTFSEFEVISATIWKSLSKCKEDLGPKVVTICTYNSTNRENEIPSNDMVLGVVETDLNVRECSIMELVTLIDDRKMYENCTFDDEDSDFVVYGANLTFVDMEEAKVYDLQLNGEKPAFASYNIDGVGDEGVVLVLLSPEDGECESCGRTVNVVLPGNQLAQLKNELKEVWGVN